MKTTFKCDVVASLIIIVNGLVGLGLIYTYQAVMKERGVAGEGVPLVEDTTPSTDSIYIHPQMGIKDIYYDKVLVCTSDEVEKRLEEKRKRVATPFEYTIYYADVLEITDDALKAITEDIKESINTATNKSIMRLRDYGDVSTYSTDKRYTAEGSDR